MHSVIRVPSGKGTPPMLAGAVEMRLPSWLELSNRRNSSTAVRMSDGSAIRRAFSVRPIEQCIERVADQVGRGLVAGVEQEDAVVQQLGFAQALAVLFTENEAREHVDVRITRTLPALHDQLAEIREHFGHRGVASFRGLRTHHGFECTEDRQRPRAQRAAFRAWHVEQIADDLHRDRAGEGIDQVGLGLRADRVEQPFHQGRETGLHRGDVARRERTGDETPHPRVIRRIVEDEAGGVMLEQRRRAVLRRELLPLVGAEELRFLVDGNEVVVARQQDRTVAAGP